MEFLYQNSISTKVISIYLSSVHAKAKLYGWDTSATSHPAVHNYICSISINSRLNPTLQDIFDIPILYNLSLSWDILSDPVLFRAVFLSTFYGFLRMSNIARHSSSKFNPDFHFVRQVLIYSRPGVHLLIKWTNTLQHYKSYHRIQLPSINNHFLCPVRGQVSWLPCPFPQPPTISILMLWSLTPTIGMP